MHFERIYMPDTYEGTAKEAFEQLTENTQPELPLIWHLLIRKKQIFFLEIRKISLHHATLSRSFPVTLMCADLPHVHMGIKTFSISYVDG